MACHGCIPSGPIESDGGNWRETWSPAFDSEDLGLEVIHYRGGRCVATDLSTLHEIGRGNDLASLCDAIARFYLFDPLPDAIRALQEVGSRA